MSDGLSNTIAVGEASNYAIDSAGNRKDIDGSFPVGWITGTTASGTPPNYNPGFSPTCWNITTIRYAPNSRDYNRPGIRDNHGPNNPLMSAHSGGVHCLLADGSVRFVNETIDVMNLKRLARRDDGRNVDEF
jgi:prepilin-type processing-associated H-X9-DG protein